MRRICMISNVDLGPVTVDAKNPMEATVTQLPLTTVTAWRERGKEGGNRLFSVSDGSSNGSNGGLG